MPEVRPTDEAVVERTHEMVLNGCTHYRGEKIRDVFLRGFSTTDEDGHPHTYMWDPQTVRVENGRYQVQMVPREV